jgi:hypothetical protein
MGRTAADVLFEVAAAKEIDINSLTIEDVSRKEAVKHLCDEGFLEASSRADDGSGTVLELTAWGYLAVTGGRHAGWPDSLGD